jgi:hypothetical protein
LRHARRTRTPHGTVESRQLEVHGMHTRSKHYGYNISASVAVVAMWPQWEYALRTIIESIRVAPLGAAAGRMARFWNSHRPPDVVSDRWPPPLPSEREPAPAVAAAQS